MRLLGKKPAVVDHRVKRYTARLTSKLPAAPDNVVWYAKMPDTGLPMLLNDQLGCCVAATCCHFVGQSSLYAAERTPLVPTDPECLAIYVNSGYVPGNPSTDQGWSVLGPGGLIEAWTKGFVIGGKINKVGPVASVDFKNSEELRVAIALYGFVLTGAALTQADVESDFMFNDVTGKIIGYHEFLIAGCEKVAGHYYYDVLTWNGRWRATEAWVQARADEAAVVYDEVFFNARGVSAGAVNKSALYADLANFHAA